jgi:hypothetical protein
MKKQRMFSLNVFLILVICLNACPQSPGKLELRVRSERVTTSVNMTITGKNFTPNQQVTITITNFPKSDGNITSTATSDASGNFTLPKSFAFKSVGRDEEFINILVTARDEATGQVVIENISPEPYLIRT